MNLTKMTRQQLVDEVMALQNALQAQQGRLQTATFQPSIISSAADAIILLDEKQNILQFNTAAEEIFGYKEADILGQPIDILLPALAPHNQQIDRPITAFTTMHFLKMQNGLRADGEVFRIETSMSQISIHNRKFSMIMLRDVGKNNDLEKLIMRQYDSLNTLHLVTLDLLNRRDIQDLLQFIVDQAVNLLDVSYCEILLPEDNKLVAQAYTHKRPFLDSNRFARNEGYLSWQVFDTGKPVVLDNYSNWSKRHNIYENENFYAAAGLPLLVENHCIGVLGLTRNRLNHKFSEEHMLTATRLAAIAALAIENSRLYLEIKKLATTDELTGANNRRNLIEIGQREIERAIRYDRPLSILMLDVDHFKRVNDTWGHPTGDVVLRGITQECMKQIRKSDLISRYGELQNDTENVIGRFGGEEFCILLPETSLAGGMVIAERIRAAMEKKFFHAVEQQNESKSQAYSGSGLQVTISIGVAHLDSVTDGFESLLAKADNALYEAKESGRNRVCAAAHSEGKDRMFI